MEATTITAASPVTTSPATAADNSRKRLGHTNEFITQDRTERILFPVEKLPVEQVLEGYTTTSDKRYFVVGTVNEETADGGTMERKRLLNVCSDRQTLVPNREIFPRIEQMLDASGLEFGVMVRDIDYEKFYVDYIFTGYTQTIPGTGETVCPRLHMRHSYNGKMSFSWSFGFFHLEEETPLGLPLPPEKLSAYGSAQKLNSVDAVTDIQFGDILQELSFFLLQAPQLVANWGVLNQATDQRHLIPGTGTSMVINEIFESDRKMPRKGKNIATGILRRIAGRIGKKYPGNLAIYLTVNQIMQDPNSCALHYEVRDTLSQEILSRLYKGALELQRVKAAKEKDAT